MRDAFFLGLLIFLQISIYVNIKFIRSYIVNKKKGSIKGLLITGVAILFIGILMLIIMMHTSDVVSKFQMQQMMVLESGLIFLYLASVKVRITIRVIKRSKLQKYYDISFFGKKVFRPDVVKKSELAIFILSMPFTLITGAYFFANIFFK